MDDARSAKDGDWQPQTLTLPVKALMMHLASCDPAADDIRVGYFHLYGPRPYDV